MYMKKERKKEREILVVVCLSTRDSWQRFICLVIKPLLLHMHNTGQRNLMKPLCSRKNGCKRCRALSALSTFIIRRSGLWVLSCFSVVFSDRSSVLLQRLPLSPPARMGPLPLTTTWLVVLYQMTLFIILMQSESKVMLTA